jgi:hypothetical protein
MHVAMGYLGPLLLYSRVRLRIRPMYMIHAFLDVGQWLLIAPGFRTAGVREYIYIKTVIGFDCWIISMF